MFNFVPPTIMISLHPTRYILCRKALQQLIHHINKKNKQKEILQASDGKAKEMGSIKISVNKKNKELNAYFLDEFTSLIKEIKAVFNAGKDM